LSNYEKRIAASRTPDARKKNADGVRRARAKETPAQRELHNAKIAVAYRRATWLIYGKGREWIRVAEERLRKATVAVSSAPAQTRSQEE
jgi:hypothetical protein